MKRVSVLFALAASAALIAGLLEWRQGDVRGATVSLAVALSFACIAGMQRNSVLAWPAWGAILVAGALVVHGFLT